jgi:hypothetical protein
MADTLHLPPAIAPLIGAAQLAARGPTPTLEAPAGYTLIQYAGLQVTPVVGQGDVDVEEEDVLVLLANCIPPNPAASGASALPTVSLQLATVRQLFFALRLEGHHFTHDSLHT